MPPLPNTLPLSVFAMFTSDPQLLPLVMGRLKYFQQISHCVDTSTKAAEKLLKNVGSVTGLFSAYILFTNQQKCGHIINLFLATSDQYINMEYDENNQKHFMNLYLLEKKNQ
jgi:hypothetical protein